ncbi:ferredoxin [Brevibacterium luteolum]|uniref:ferredoxin n=1 Tax=Brevibacterium luteolum TaxID=199591 RepID=UPI001C23AB70|nr:ferredoxin [Brevibacterium luteolum]MBU8577622.1 ferredoxin [Brevibacterium luteolum]
MKVHVDLNRCESNGLCVLTAPEVFELDGDQRLHYEEFPDEELWPDVEDAARNCPVQAITITRSTEGDVSGQP